MTAIEQLAVDILDEREWQLVNRLVQISDDDTYDAGSLIKEILPVYCERVGDKDHILFPSNIYRPLYYIHSWSSCVNFRESTRAYMMVISGHLEGCLLYLTSSPPSKYGVPSQPFGRLIGPLKSSGILSERLADQLWRFNSAVNVPAKHFGAYVPTQRLDERTFSPLETVCAFVMARRLSVELFKILNANGVVLPHGWPDFRDEWLSWSRKIDQNPE